MIRIITDSAADFEPRELEQKQIICIPLVVSFGQQDYQENVDLSKKQFYELLHQADDLPKTSQASPQILIDLFEDAKQHGDDAIYITLSSALSGTYQSALMAQRMANSPLCHVIDSRNATGGQRILVEYALRLRDEGKSALQIVEAVKALRRRIVLFACMDTLENLYMGGRISQAAYTLGSIAQIKPLLQVDREGRVAVPAKAMGMRKGIDYLCKKVEQFPPDAQFPFYVMYTDDRSKGLQLAEHFRSMGHWIPDEHIIQVGAAIGTHIGMGAIGFVCVGPQQ